jgi:hypothetical protein
LVIDLIDYFAAHFFGVTTTIAPFSFITLRAALGLALCLALAMLSRKFFEQPILGLKRYFKPTD